MSWHALPPGIHSRTLAVNDLEVHFFEALPDVIPAKSQPPLVILLHGFPEMAYSWRKIMAPLSAAGYHVVAPDQRGYGCTKRRSIQGDHDKYAFEDDLSSFHLINLAIDIISLVYALKYTSVTAIVGHDFGSSVAGWCAFIRPDIFKSVVLMSATFTGAPPFHPEKGLSSKSLIQVLDEGLASLTPPRKHYTMYYSTRQADADMTHPPQGLHQFLREYFHVKSGDWSNNQPYRLPDLSPTSFGLLPKYYVMDLGETMPQAVAHDAPSSSEVESNTWLTDDELAVYVTEYSKTGFQGGLNHYRCITEPRWTEYLRVFSGRRIEVPAMFLSGKQDWGVYQYPGAAEKMSKETCAQMLDEDFVLVPGAGHWVQQEAPEAVIEHLMRFLGKQRTSEVM